MAYLRSRSRSDITDLAISYRYASYPVSCANLTLGSWTNVNGTIKHGTSKATSDWVTPNYWRLKREGKIGWSFNPFGTISRKYQSSSGAGYRTTSNGTTCTPPLHQYTEVEGPNIFTLVLKNFMGGQPEPVPILGDRIHSLTTEVWTRCLADRQKGEANLIESLAELDKAWAMVANPLENIRKFNDRFAREKNRRRKELLKRLRPRGNPPRRFRMQKELAKALAAFLSAEWLRYRYGITPMINDVKAGFKVLKKEYDKEPQLHTARAKGVVQLVNTTHNSTLIGSYTWKWDRADTDYFSVRAQFTDRYDLNAFNDLGFTFHNLVGVAWELTHFSFVVDWFINAGDLIYANVPRIGVTPVGGGVTHKRLTTSYYYATSITEPTSTITGCPSDTYLAQVDEIVRTPDYKLQQGLVFRDNLKLDTFNRAADSITLIIQQLGRLRF